MKKLMLFVVLLAGCTNDDATRRVLRDQGYTNIELTGHDMFTCADSDDTCTGFKAVSPAGRPVHGAVGCGYFAKGCTIRFK